jgi:lipid A 3-O-deacylase
LSWTGYYALLDGGVFNGRSDYYKEQESSQQPYRTDKGIHPFFDGGLVLSSGKVSWSITQKIMPPLLQGYQAHPVGNISFTVGW